MDNIKSTNFIRYNPERIDYTLTGEELEQLQNTIQNSWKDFCIGAFALGVPCLINSISEVSNQRIFVPTISFNINLVIGILGLSLGFVFLVLWQKSKKQTDILLDKIKTKPKISIVRNDVEINQIIIDTENIVDKDKLNNT
jgi:hypothetical protein